MNIPAVGMISALMTLLGVEGEPGAANLKKERETLLTFFKASMNTLFGPQGYPEEDIGYGTAMAGFISRPAEALNRAGIINLYKDYPGYVKYGNAMVHFMQPWGTFLTNTGDHGDDIGYRELILPRVADETHAPGVLWMHGSVSYPSADVDAPDYDPGFQKEVSVGKGLSVPNSFLSMTSLFGQTIPDRSTLKHIPTAFCDEGRGIVSFRSGWDKNDLMLTIDGSQRSPSAQGHAHMSAGHFNLSALGEYFSIDTGRYNIDQDQHSVTLVNGKSGRCTEGEWKSTTHAGRLLDYEPNALCDYASVDSVHQTNCFWANRHIGLVKGDGMCPYVWIVDDINANNDFNTYWFQVQTHPQNTVKVKSNSAEIHGCNYGNILQVHAVIPDKAEYPKSHAVEWDTDISPIGSHKYADRAVTMKKMTWFPHRTVHHSVPPRPRLLAKVSGYNGRFMTLLVPRKKGATAPRIKTLKTLTNSLAAEVAYKNVTDTIIFAYEHQLLEANGIKAVGDFAVVRRSKKSGKVIDSYIRNGHLLES
jgi:hypothetical protein